MHLQWCSSPQPHLPQLRHLPQLLPASPSLAGTGAGKGRTRSSQEGSSMAAAIPSHQGAPGIPALQETNCAGTFSPFYQRRGPDSFEGVESEWYQGKTWSSELCPLRKSQHRLLQTICKGKRQRMLQGRQFVVPRSPGAVSCGTDPPPSQAEPCLGCPGAARPQTGANSSFLLLQAPSGAQTPACTGCRNSRMPGYHRDTHEVQTQGHRCTNPVMENVPLGRFRIRRFFFLKQSPDHGSQVGHSAEVILPALLSLAQGNLIMANPFKPLWQGNTALPAPCPQKGAPETPEVP